MKVGFSLVLGSPGDVEDMLLKIRDAGFDGFEPTLLATDGLPNLADPERSAETLRAMADRAGLEVPSLRGGPAFWPTFAAADAAIRRTALDIARKAMRAVKILGGDVLLIVPGRLSDSRDYEQAVNRATDSAKRVAELAEKSGVRVGVENVENRLFLSPLEMRDLIDAVNSPMLGAYYDVGNTMWLAQGYSEDWIRILGKRIIRVHFKDGLEGKHSTYLLQGDVNWPAVASALRAIEYESYVCVELPPYKFLPERMLQETCRNARAILAL